jgi:hypothetical protein
MVRLGLSLLYILVTIWPVIKRLRQPTILGDDVARLVDLIEHPFHELIFLPFGEHVAPLFQLVSWLVWRAIGPDIRLAPMGFTIASVLPWLLALSLLAVWLIRETGSRTASLTAVAIVAQSPLVLETAWWYSASSFSWAIAGILLSLIGATLLAHKPVRALALVAIGAAIAPAGTSLGFLAAPLAILRGMIEPGTGRRAKVMLMVAAMAGLLAYDRSCKLGSTELITAARASYLDKLNLPLGLGFAFSVPGRVLWPVALGVPVSWSVSSKPAWYSWGAGALALAVMAAAAAWPRVRRYRGGMITGAAMIYSTYMLIYSERASLLLRDRPWSEQQLLYEWGGRYHVLPLLGLAAILAAVMASWPFPRRCDGRPWLPPIVGSFVGLVMLVVQYPEASYWNWMLRQPGQKQTLDAIDHLGKVAREEGIPRSQLKRIIGPAFRSWNQSLVFDRPAAFSLMNLVTLAPERVAVPLGDAEALARLKRRLNQRQRLALGSQCCFSLNRASLHPGAETLVVARPDGMTHAHELRPGHYRADAVPAAIRFEFDPAPAARYLALPGFRADQDIVISWCDNTGQWRSGQSVRWLKLPRSDDTAIVDLDGLIHQPDYPLSRIAIQFTRPGELTLAGSPRLLR